MRRLWKLIKYRLRLLGLWPNNITRPFIEGLKQNYRDIEIIWTGKEYPAGSVDNFRSLGSVDTAFRTVVLNRCAEVVRERKPDVPLVFCRMEHDLFWSIGLSALCPNPIIVSDCDLRVAGQLGLRYVHADLLSLPFRDQTFDLVAIPHYLYYAGVSFVPQNRFDPNGDERLLREINRTLRPGGTLVGMVFVKQGLTSLPIGFQRARGVHHFRDMLQRCGFDLAAETYFHRSSMEPIPSREVSAALPSHTRPGDGFADRLVFVCEKAR
jgi:SAM-dependent methyltransferase